MSSLPIFSPSSPKRKLIQENILRSHSLRNRKLKKMKTKRPTTIAKGPQTGTY